MDGGFRLRSLAARPEANLLVRDVAAALPFHRDVLGAEVVYGDPDFAVLRWHGPPEVWDVPHRPKAVRPTASPRRPGGTDIYLLDADGYCWVPDAPLRDR